MYLLLRAASKSWVFLTVPIIDRLAVMAYRRALLEILKWTEPRSVLSEYSHVSIVWKQACTTEELWISFCEDCEDCEASLSPGISPTDAYRSHSQLQHSLPVLKADSLSRFSDKTHELKTVLQFQHPLQEIYCLAAVLLPEGQLLCCGGNSNSAVLIEASGTQVELLNMRFQRSFHCAIHYVGTVYVFGGAENTAEKLPVHSIAALPNQSWESLPNMHYSRSACSPCVSKGLVYLFGGNTDKCEVFSPLTETFADLPLILPEVLYGCVAFPTKDDGFLILSGGYVTRWKPNANENPEMWGNPTKIPGVWTCMEQLLVGDKVYSAERGVIRVFSLETQIRKPFSQ